MTGKPTGAQGAVPVPQCECVCHKVGLLGFMCCPCTVAIIQRLANSSEACYLNPPATPEPHSLPITSGYVQEVRLDAAEEPSCHVCGAIMVRTVLDNNRAGWVCLSCNTTTGCT